MAASMSRAAVETWIDVPFNAWLGIILAVVFGCAVRKPGVLLLGVLVVSATILAFDTTSTVGETIKVICLLPLGLGSVLAFLVASRPLKAKALPFFETYVTLAVYGNIGMMVATPAGGTIRGMCSKVACVSLFIWIVQQGRRAGWRTIRLHDDFFVFTSVSKPWIFSHAVYRFVLLTLPCFKSGRRHRLLEVYSLSLTYALSTASNLPFEYCFGMADTLVAPAAAGWSAIASTFDLIPRDVAYHGPLSDRADACLGAVSLAVAVFACFNIARAQRSEPQHPHTT